MLNFRAQHHHHSAPHNFYALPYLSGGLGMGRCIASLDQIFFCWKTCQEVSQPLKFNKFCTWRSSPLKRNLETIDFQRLGSFSRIYSSAVLLFCAGKRGPEVFHTSIFGLRTRRPGNQCPVLPPMRASACRACHAQVALKQRENLHARQIGSPTLVVR